MKVFEISAADRIRARAVMDMEAEIRQAQHRMPRADARLFDRICNKLEPDDEQKMKLSYKIGDDGRIRWDPDLGASMKFEMLFEEDEISTLRNVLENFSAYGRRDPALWSDALIDTIINAKAWEPPQMGSSQSAMAPTASK